MITLPKLWQREFPLIVFQIWGRSYKVFLGDPVAVFPRYVFVIKNELGEVFRNPALTDTVNSIINKRVEQNPKYLQQFYNEHLNLLEKLENFYKQKSLIYSDLLKFLDTLLEFWPAIYASWFIPPSESFHKEDRDLFLDLRKKIQHVEHDAHHLVNRTIKSLHPEIGELAWAVSLQEALNNNFPAREILIKRAVDKIIVFEDEVVSKSEFRNLQTKFDFELEKAGDTSNIKVISGQIACKGKVRGHVKKVLKEVDVCKLEDGEILVTSMTLPTFAQAMKKAAAFVTDEGGITCHAAINAREMNKPCIIGTKIATQALKDGDMVEVNADSGEIVILE